MMLCLQDVKTQERRRGTSACAVVMSFDAAAFAEKLSQLNASQASIETISQWCLFHRRHCKDVVGTWASQLSQAPSGRKLAFILLCNDICQQSRKRGSEYIEAFARALPGALRHVCKHSADAEAPLRRLVGVWEERGVFGRNRTLGELKLAVGLLALAEAEGGEGTEGGVASAWAALRSAESCEPNASSPPVLAARQSLLDALRAACVAQEQLLAQSRAAATAHAHAQAEPPAGEAGAGAPSEQGAPPGDQYDPSDALLFTTGEPQVPGSRHLQPGAAATAAVMDALSSLPPDQREAIGTALAAAAAAAAAAERGSEPLVSQPSLGGWMDATPEEPCAKRKREEEQETM